ncbi:PLP-dependent aminotransferase family protein [Mycolicibacterium sp. CH28]|uniref:aminotransferase-like domain-containing protein n=1 Tax=Mycolicibacterium sp. CH28 TaxID=2512237 RepID=UPI001080BC62|nr:PLP-dependent aminotransferase family protein [Mycolicibacterium sp. CH28]TGD86255.1 PLP-dependent aminotransferase family protein [Mycolicibacterium sp. CH28]
MGRARYRRVVDALASDIRSGTLAPGARLPTHRELAACEGLALATASRVYAELAALGLVSGETGRGTFVRALTVPPSHGIDQPAVAADVIDMNFNSPALAEQADLLRTALRDLAARGDVAALLRYQPHAGQPHERSVIAEHLRERGLHADPKHVLIVSGAQHGLAVTVLAALKPGDVVAVDALTYPGFKVLAEAHQLELVPLPAASDGSDLDALERLCAAESVRAIYTMPTMHNPLSWISPADWRERLTAIARRHRLLVIEDAAYAFLAEDPPPPVAALLPESTVYISGLSKSVATGLRFGFLRAPADLVAPIERAIRATTWNAPPLVTAIATSWIEDGTVARLEAAKRGDARHRNAVARAILTGHDLVGHPSSYILWLPLPADVRPDQVVADLLDHRVAATTAEPFATTGHTPRALRLALGSVEIDQLERALQTVAEIVDDHTYR